MGTQRLSFVHVNDQHSSFVTLGDISPWARQRGAFERARAANPFTLFTNAGDDHEKGSVAEHMADGPEGSLVPELVRAMEFDVRTIGNHDFCHSVHNVAELTHDPVALVVVSNICPAATSTSLSWGAVRFGVRQVGALRVGFFGLVSRPWDELQRQPIELQYYEPELLCDFAFERVARELVAAHRAEVDLLVHVSHLGLRGDVELCEAVGGIDIVLGGHSHTVLERVRVANGAAIIHCGASGEYVGQLDLEVSTAGAGCRVLGYELKRTQDEAPHEPTAAKIASIVAARAGGWDSPLLVAPSSGTIDNVQRFAAEALLHRPLGGPTAGGGACYGPDVVLLDDALVKLRKPSYVAWDTGEQVSLSLPLSLSLCVRARARARVCVCVRGRTAHLFIYS